LRCWPEVENLRPHFPGASSGLDLGRDSRGAHCTAQIYKQKSGAITEGLGAGRDVTKWSHRVLPYGLIGFCPSARAADLVALSRQLNSSEGHDTPRRIVCLRSRVLLSSCCLGRRLSLTSVGAAEPTNHFASVAGSAVAAREIMQEGGACPTVAMSLG